jgi:hypothetical protein
VSLRCAASSPFRLVPISDCSHPGYRRIVYAHELRQSLPLSWVRDALACLDIRCVRFAHPEYRTYSGLCDTSQRGPNLIDVNLSREANRVGLKVSNFESPAYAAVAWLTASQGILVAARSYGQRRSSCASTASHKGLFSSGLRDDSVPGSVWLGRLRGGLPHASRRGERKIQSQDGITETK